MKIGLFFGSFNPIHIGHLVIAGYMTEFTAMEQVWLVVSPHNPFKKKSSLLTGNFRLQLVREAISENSKLKASDIEFKLPQPSYTINTLIYLCEKYPAHTFSLIMGSDNLQTLHKWKNYEQIIQYHSIYVYPRTACPKMPANLSVNGQIELIEAPLMEISSSFIRKAIKEKKDIRYMLPEKVYKYIKEMHFYER